MCEIIPPSPPSLPAYPLPAHTPLGTKATTRRSCEIKDDDAEGMASPSRHPKQGSANRGTRWRGRRPGRFREEGGEGRVRRGTKVRSGAYGRRPSFYSIAGEVKRGLRPPSSTHLKRKVCPLIKKIMLLLYRTYSVECCVVCLCSAETQLLT
jgi:hypothetical protein